MIGAGVEPVAGYGASPAPFPQFLPPALTRKATIDDSTPTAGRQGKRGEDGEIGTGPREPHLPAAHRGRPWSTCPAELSTYTLCPMPRRAPVVTPLNPVQGPRSTRFRGDRGGTTPHRKGGVPLDVDGVESWYL